MSKGIIVVDIPDFCMDCNFCREIDEGIEACCEMTVDYENNDCYRMIDDYCQSKPDWCPIVPLLQEDIYYARGWHGCLDMISRMKSVSRMV